MVDVFHINEPKKVPVIPLFMRKLYKKKIKISKQIKTTRSSVRMVTLRKKLQLIEEEITSNKEERIKKKEEDVISKIKTDPKEFYRYARTKTTVKSGVGPMRDGKNITSDELRMPEILSKQYQSMFSEPIEDINKMDLNNLYQDQWFDISDITVTMKESLQ